LFCVFFGGGGGGGGAYLCVPTEQHIDV